MQLKEMVTVNQFNIRVYLIVYSDNGSDILLSDEYIQGSPYTKFPGGGLEFGEGIIDCAHREALEEFGQEIELLGHFYTTDFFQQSAFRTQDQILSIYYKARFLVKPSFQIARHPFEFSNRETGSESFRWLRIADLDQSLVSLPIDKHVIGLLKKEIV